MKLLFILSSLIAVTCFFSCGIEPVQSVSSAPARNGDWRLYTPPDKTFSVELPCEPAQTNVSASSPSYEYSCHLEEADNLRFFTISVWKADFEGAKIRDEAAFERSVKESFTPNHRMVKIVPIRIDGGIRREVIVTNTRDEMDNLRGRVIIFGNHRFEVAYVATDMKRLESVEADRFFTGFKPLR
jgi:hypothetical protein